MLGERLPRLDERGWCLDLSCSAGGDEERPRLEPWVRGPRVCSTAMVALANCSSSLHDQRFVVDVREREGEGAWHVYVQVHVGAGMYVK